MNNKDLSVLIKKAEELKALFVLGQRVIPFLEEIFMFVNDIKPLLDEINNSITENLKKMPSASDQLSKVTEATEMATTEIMDIVDGLVYKSDLIKSDVDQINSMLEKKPTALEVLNIIKKALEQDTDKDVLLEKINITINNLNNVSKPSAGKIVSHIDEIIESIQMDSSSIMMALQVQDITSQQIAAVNHLLETIQGKLKTILNRFDKTDVGDIIKTDFDESVNISKLHRNIAFDPDAVSSISLKDSRQSDVDSIIESASEEDLDNIDIESLKEEDDVAEETPVETSNEEVSLSTDEIDNLFNTDDISTDSVQEDTKSEDSNDPEEEDERLKNIDLEDGNETFSQDDIDALFG